MGYEYELLTRFADHIDVQLDLIVAEDREEYLKKQAEAQFAVPEAELVAGVKKVLARHKA